MPDAAATARQRPTPQRTTLRWRLTLVPAAVAAVVGLLLLLLSVALVDRALSTGALDLPRGLGVVLPDGRVLTLEELQRSLRDEAIARLVRQGLWALLLLGALGTAVSYLLAGRVLRPLQDITATARRLSAERLDARIALAGPQDELRELADVFDAMLDRLQGSFEAQRRFVADASHELRTPLAVMRTEVDVALADPDASTEDLRAAALVVREATERADRLVDSLLLLARGDRLQVDGLPYRERVELPDLAAAALSEVEPEVAARGLQVASARAPAGVLGHRVLLERLAGNLVENAVRHNVDGGWLRVDTGTVEGRARLQVASSGPVVPPAEVEQLFEPFRRHGTARTARRGAGLGLAIVRAVAAGHGGTVRAAAPPEGGLVVTVDLPRSP
ncbi:MAG TPA: HAMP domain-containing sensor histidine kinase [Mycobacteriales bacterium]|nr:HAMP domain-containing sensor histidine kinase [Mycobacteriales bacterium]